MPSFNRPSVSLFLIVLSVQSWLGAALFGQSGTPEQDRKDLEKLAKSLKIEIRFQTADLAVTTAHGLIAGVAAQTANLDRYIGLFVEEFSLYPADLVKRSRLTRVVFCEKLAFAGQLRSAIPDFEHDVLYYDVGRAIEDRPYLRSVIHHEYFHMIDYRDDGKVYEDKVWAALNPEDFHYGTGGANAQHIATTGVLTDKYPGFLDHYSTTGVEEDKAEIYCHLIVNGSYVAGRAAKEPVIAAKVRQMKKLLQKFSPAMNEKFWERVKSLERKDAR